MANIPPIQFKRSNHAGAVPLPSQLAVGELAINMADRNIWSKDSEERIISLGNAGGAEGNVMTVLSIDDTNYVDIAAMITQVTPKQENSLIAGNIQGVYQVAKVTDPVANEGIIYRILLDKDHLIINSEYPSNNAGTNVKAFSRDYIYDNSSFIPQTSYFDYEDEWRMHQADNDIGLIHGDVAEFTIQSSSAQAAKTVRHYWNDTLSRWEAPGEVQFFTTGSSSIDTANLELFWPAADNNRTQAKIYDLNTNTWYPFSSNGTDWIATGKDSGVATSFVTFSTAAELAAADVGNALVFLDADDTTAYYQTNTGNTTSQNNARVSDTEATGIWYNVASDGIGDVSFRFTATNAYDYRYDMLHAFDQTSQGWLSNSKTGYLQVNCAIESVSQGTFKPEGFTVRGRNVSTSSDYMSRIDWTFTFTDGHTWTATTTGTDRYYWQRVDIPITEYGDPASTIGVSNIRMVCTRGSSWGGLWGFQTTGHQRTMYPTNGLYYKSNNTGVPYQDITRIT